MIVAIVNTGRFEFRAYETHHAAAEQALLAAYAKHCRQYPSAETSLMQELIDGGEAQFTMIDIGDVHRDDQQFHTHN